MKEIQLTQGKVAMVDDSAYEFINQYKWFAQKGYSTFYAVRKISGKPVQMHRVLMCVVGKKCLVDHKDHNGLNNQRSNLRVATLSQNMSNRTNDYNALSKYLGVVWQSSHKSWRARIQKDGVQKHIGYFKNEIDAAIAYNKAAMKLHGEFANLNPV